MGVFVANGLIVLVGLGVGVDVLTGRDGGLGTLLQQLLKALFGTKPLTPSFLAYLQIL